MRVVWFVMGWLVCAIVLAPAARADRPFAIRYSANDLGSITFAANTVMTCPDSAPTCASARLGLQGGSLGNNNGYAMTYVDADGSGNGTFDSSTATLSLPPDSFVLFAGLYWAGDTSAGATVGTVRGVAAPTPAARGSVQLRLPGAPSYQSLSAATLDTNGTRFSGFADVTDAVRQAGPGAYTVANLQSGTGGDRYGAWDLVVAYRDRTQPARNLTVFDGLATISQSSPVASLSLTGFTTPPSGPVRSVVGLISSEGDRTSTGDSASLNARALFDDLNPPDNVFNSSISELGARFTAKLPDYVNQLGSDANSFGADGYLANGATSATIRLTTGGETYYPSVVFFTSEIYSPEIRPAKSVVDVNRGAPERGDVLEYTVRLTNTGQDAATGLRFFDPIPARSTLCAGQPGVHAGRARRGVPRLRARRRTRPMAIRRSSILTPIARSTAWAPERRAMPAGDSIPARRCACGCGCRSIPMLLWGRGSSTRAPPTSSARRSARRFPTSSPTRRR